MNDCIRKMHILALIFMVARGVKLLGSATLELQNHMNVSHVTFHFVSCNLLTICRGHIFVWTPSWPSLSRGTLYHNSIVIFQELDVYSPSCAPWLGCWLLPRLFRWYSVSVSHCSKDKLYHGCHGIYLPSLWGIMERLPGDTCHLCSLSIYAWPQRLFVLAIRFLLYRTAGAESIGVVFNQWSGWRLHTIGSSSPEGFDNWSADEVSGKWRTLQYHIPVPANQNYTFHFSFWVIMAKWGVDGLLLTSWWNSARQKISCSL